MTIAFCRQGHIAVCWLIYNAVSFILGELVGGNDEGDYGLGVDLTDGASGETIESVFRGWEIGFREGERPAKDV